jgi:hypothetical protein
MQLFEVCHTKSRFAAMSVHAPFTTHSGIRSQILSEMTKLVLPQHRCLIAGDFNVTLETMGPSVVEQYFPSQRWVDAFEGVPFSVESGRKIDFAFVTIGNGMKVVANSVNVEPKDLAALVLHAENAPIPVSPFFSDHTALFATICL